MTDDRRWLASPYPRTAEAAGSLIVHEDGETLLIERADPRIHISGELHDDILEGRCNPAVRLDHRFGGDVLTIDAANQRVVYRITGYDMLRDFYIAEWPD